MYYHYNNIVLCRSCIWWRRATIHCYGETSTGAVQVVRPNNICLTSRSGVVCVEMDLLLDDAFNNKFIKYIQIRPKIKYLLLPLLWHTFFLPTDLILIVMGHWWSNKQYCKASLDKNRKGLCSIHSFSLLPNFAGSKNNCFPTGMSKT